MCPVGVDVSFTLHVNSCVSGKMFSTGQFTFTDGVILVGSFMCGFDECMLTGLGVRHYVDGRRVQEYWNNGRLIRDKGEVEQVCA